MANYSFRNVADDRRCVFTEPGAHNVQSQFQESAAELGCRFS